MSGGSSVCVFFILPLGIYCLSACRIVLMSRLLAECTLVGVGVSVSEFSMCCVNSDHFAFL